MIIPAKTPTPQPEDNDDIPQDTVMAESPTPDAFLPTPIRDQSDEHQAELQPDEAIESIPPIEVEESPEDRLRTRRKQRHRSYTSPSTKHNIYTHFPKCPNCKICNDSKPVRKYHYKKPIYDPTKPPRPIPTVFGDAITADHKILSERNENRHKHKAALIIQDQATKFINQRKAIPNMKQRLQYDTL